MGLSVKLKYHHMIVQPYAHIVEQFLKAAFQGIVSFGEAQTVYIFACFHPDFIYYMAPQPEGIFQYPEVQFDDDPFINGHIQGRYKSQASGA